MESSAIAHHLTKLYENGLYSDTIINIFGKTFRVHRVVLSMSGYFNAVMSETWTNLATGPAPPTSASSSGGTPQSMPAGQLSGLGLLEALPTRLDGPTAPASVPAFGLASSGPQATTGSVLEFDIDTSDHGLRSSRGGRTSRGGAGPGLSGCVLGGSLATGYENDRDAVTGRAEITLPAFEDMLRYLYGIPPRMEHSSVKSLLVTASYFDVPPLMSSVSDFVFSHLGHDNVMDYLLLVHNKEYGEPGKLIEDASFAYLYRNAMDIGAPLYRLPLCHQKKILTATELFSASEYHRYKLAVTVKRAARGRILMDMRKCGVYAGPDESADLGAGADAAVVDAPATSVTAARGVRAGKRPGSRRPSRDGDKGDPRSRSRHQPYAHGGAPRNGGVEEALDDEDEDETNGDQNDDDAAADGEQRGVGYNAFVAATTSAAGITAKAWNVNQHPQRQQRQQNQAGSAPTTVDQGQSSQQTTGAADPFESSYTLVPHNTRETRNSTGEFLHTNRNNSSNTAVMAAHHSVFNGGGSSSGRAQGGSGGLNSQRQSAHSPSNTLSRRLRVDTDQRRLAGAAGVAGGSSDQQPLSGTAGAGAGVLNGSMSNPNGRPIYELASFSSAASYSDVERNGSTAPLSASHAAQARRLATMSPASYTSGGSGRHHMLSSHRTPGFGDHEGTWTNGNGSSVAGGGNNRYGSARSYGQGTGRGGAGGTLSHGHGHPTAAAAAAAAVGAGTGAEDDGQGSAASSGGAGGGGSNAGGGASGHILQSAYSYEETVNEDEDEEMEDHTGLLMSEEGRDDDDDDDGEDARDLIPRAAAPRAVGRLGAAGFGLRSGTGPGAAAARSGGAVAVGMGGPGLVVWPASTAAAAGIGAGQHVQQATLTAAVPPPTSAPLPGTGSSSAAAAPGADRDGSSSTTAGAGAPGHGVAGILRAAAARLWQVAAGSRDGSGEHDTDREGDGDSGRMHDGSGQAGGSSTGVRTHGDTSNAARELTDGMDIEAEEEGETRSSTGDADDGEGNGMHTAMHTPPNEQQQQASNTTVSSAGLVGRGAWIGGPLGGTPNRPIIPPPSLPGYGTGPEAKGALTRSSITGGGGGAGPRPTGNMPTGEASGPSSSASTVGSSAGASMGSIEGAAGSLSGATGGQAGTGFYTGLGDKVLPFSPTPTAKGNNSMTAAAGGGFDRHSRSSSGGYGSALLRDFKGELAELDAVYREVFAGLRWMHFTVEQLNEALQDGEADPSFIQAAVADQEKLRLKLEVANKYNVRRLSDLMPPSQAPPDPRNVLEVEKYNEQVQKVADIWSTAFPDGDATATTATGTTGTAGGGVIGHGAEIREEVMKFKWPGFRFGIEMTGVFADTMQPVAGPDGNVNGPDASKTMTSERVYFAGSIWCLDIKRYISSEDGQEFVAVYLRRRGMHNARGGAAGLPAPGPDGQQPFEDTRDRTTMGFSIRLCGAPGAPTSNSVCGRSVMGKAFGVDAEQSWGWESFVSMANLTEKPWNSGDKLRFVINLDML